MDLRLIKRFSALIQQGDARSWEDLFVRWCAEQMAEEYLRDYSEDAAAEGATLEQLTAQALADPQFVANARAQFQYDTLKTRGRPRQ